MKIITTKTETNVSDLARQLFGAKAASADQLKNAEASLRAANPQMDESAQVPAGSLLVVPPDAKISTAAVSLPGLSAELITQLQTVLADASVVLENSIASQTETAKVSMALSKSRVVAKLLAAATGAKPDLKEIAAAAKLQLKTVQAENAAQLDGLKQLAKNLNSLAG